ncbi:hypothetical protein AQUCO_01000443v1 [Aquilegia coerulea]|uniref:FAS1 domain-containing protein n=1 Tax=Aquilegia coerulea TaxID=218851 RepID=A0A2G5E9X2_AQUCA|nr:hypothetical protein AQUCO_01000443v1 [Aquilegia coerulea]
MATLLQVPLLLVIALFASFCILNANGETSMEGSSSDFPFFDPSVVLSPSQAPPPSSIGLPPQQELQSPMAVLESILTNLGFQELAVAVPSLSDSAYYTWNGPSTIFAPTDNSIRSCGASCSVAQLLREHIVPGIFSSDYLKKLAFGTKLETMSTGRCITVTSASSRDGNDTIVYIGGVEITQPDFFYNGLVVVHRLEGTTLPTMDHSGDSLMITTGGSGGGQMRINYVRIKTPDVVYNLKIAVHSVFLSFPHLHPATVEFGGVGGSGTGTLYDSAAAVGDPAIFNTKSSADNLGMGSCAASDKGCVVEAAPAPKRHKEIL